MTPTHLLDTSWIIRHLRGQAAYTHTLTRLGADCLAVSIISLAELYEGVIRATKPVAAEESLLRFLSDKTILPISEAVCRRFGEERARLRQRNQLIGDIDLLIGATCLDHKLALLTANERHFQRLPGLTIVATPAA